MSDLIPSATADSDTAEQHPVPANAEDRKAAAALSALHTNEIGTDAAPTKGRSNAEQQALDKAMSRLEIAAGQGSGQKKSAQPLKKETEVKKTVKIAAADVSFLVCTRKLSCLVPHNVVYLLIQFI